MIGKDYLNDVDTRSNPFKILKLFGNQYIKQTEIYVSSHNEQKLQACWNSLIKSNLLTGRFPKIIVRGINVNSLVPSQPIGCEQTDLGSKNRLNNMIDWIGKNNLSCDFCYSYENGIIELVDIDIGEQVYEDICYLNCYDYNNKRFYEANSHSYAVVQIPKKFYDLCVKLNQEITIGQDPKSVLKCINLIHFLPFLYIKKVVGLIEKLY